jgi:uncharacterized protein
MVIKIIIISLIVLIIAVLGYFGFSYYLATRFVSGYPSRINVSPTVISPKYEKITIKTTDNINLQGWFFPGSSDKLVIIVHGITQNRINNDYFSLLIAKDLLAEGYNVLLYDSRAHGESDGTQVTYGIKESQDIVSVVDFAKKKGFVPERIGIIADSLGAISLLLAAPKLEPVGALIADSPAAYLKTIMEGVLQRENHIPAIFNPGTFFMLKTAYHIDVDKIQPLDAVAAVPDRKFLFLHGELDLTIPPSATEVLLKKANPASIRVTFPNGSHVETYKSDPVKYRNAVLPFLQEELTQ